MRGVVAACSIAATIAIASEARADGFDFDEAFRHWGDEDHMGMRVVVGPNAVRSHGEEDHLGVGTSASARGQGVAYSYWPDTPRSFRFSGFATLGVLTSGEVTRFDGGIGTELMIGYRLTLPDFDGSKEIASTHAAASSSARRTIPTIHTCCVVKDGCNTPSTPTLRSTP